ncbi:MULTISPECIES: hypothetical protein [Vibrio]|uniref:Uncharacterized protein n=4 Tax=Vibrio TaxID=662 RepID=A0A2N7I1G0_9VIBR|nr:MULTISPECIES: hypothetical protein [Vibrio]MCZ4310327.1 hypothetical protein [Vibrio atlanticus]OEF54601.1 hypothetical protein A163_15380 [Vibrio tasmaniensis 1F-267]OEF71135.1 hypothetical protein A162_03900 [Vibrio tasmaniensis 1F-155]OEF73308.1 hypothetical protein A152_10570 [Vibrio tasmaniensis 1F-187]PML46316.1 hypothetical protein BCT76_14930 [Vibrio tasmaniensis]
MVLHTCRIVLSNQQVLTSQSVEQSLSFLEDEADKGISKIEIDATDGNQIHSYMSHSLEESIENLMNL